MLKKAIGVFIVFSPFTSYFAISAWLRFPVVLILLVYLIWSIYLLATQRLSKQVTRIDERDLILTLTLVFILISVLFNEINSRSVNHFIAYLFVFSIYYILFKRIIIYSRLDFLFIIRMMSISAFLCGLIICIDWALINIFSIGIRNYFVTVDHKIANMLYFEKGYFISVGGVAEEPGSMAILINIVFPLGLLYYRISSQAKKFIALSFLYILSLIFLASVAGLLCAAFAGAFIFITGRLKSHNSWKMKRKYLILSIPLLLGLILGVIFLIRHSDSLIGQISEIRAKLFLDDNDASANLRSANWRKAMENWLDKPIIGNGPGNGIDRYGSGYHSVYLTLLADSGLICLFLFLIFILLNFIKVYRIESPIKEFVLFALLCSTIHFSVIGDFYHAPFWILLITIHLLSGKRREYPINQIL